MVWGNVIQGGCPFTWNNRKPIRIIKIGHFYLGAGPEKSDTIDLSYAARSSADDAVCSLIPLHSKASNTVRMPIHLAGKQELGKSNHQNLFCLPLDRTSSSSRKLLPPIE